MKLFESEPDSWESVQLSEVAEINPTNPENPPDDDELASFVPMKSIEEITGNLDPSETKPWGEIKKGYTRFQERDVLFAKITPSMENGKCALAENLENGCGAGTTELHVIRCGDRLLPKFALHFVLQEGFRRKAEKNMTGTAGQMRVPKKFLETAEIPLPSIDEQQIVVAKLEEFLSQLDTGKEELKRANKRLNLYRQSLLDSGVTGNLSKEWRESTNNNNKASELLKEILNTRRQKWDERFQEIFKYSGKEYEKPEKPDTDDLFEVPESWTWTSVNQLGYVMGGLTKNKDKRSSYPHEVPYLRVANVYANELQLDEVKTIRIKDREKNTKILDEGDLLIVEGNGSKDQIGRVAMWDGSVEPCSHQNHLIRIKILRDELKKYVLYWLLSGRGRNHITEVASSTSGLYTLSLTKVRKIPVPLPPAEEVQHIVEEIEKRLTIQTQVSKTVENNVRRASTLRQSVLKAAYQGNLTKVEDKMTSISNTDISSNSNTGTGQQTLREFTGGEMND